jgi:glycosyltransferase involved in cell wall biosynthesis
VPSLWWENAPLVILEAFRHRRPVICTGIGGMAEMVAHDLNGLHAPQDDPAGWTATMQDAAAADGPWQRLADGIAPPRDLATVADDHIALYRSLLAAHAPRRRLRAA